MTSHSMRLLTHVWLFRFTEHYDASVAAIAEVKDVVLRPDTVSTRAVAASVRDAVLQLENVLNFDRDSHDKLVPQCMCGAVLLIPLLPHADCEPSGESI